MLTQLLLTGGKKFSRDVQPTDKDGNPVGLWRVCWELPEPRVNPLGYSCHITSDL